MASTTDVADDIVSHIDHHGALPVMGIPSPCHILQTSRSQQPHATMNRHILLPTHCCHCLCLISYKTQRTPHQSISPSPSSSTPPSSHSMSSAAFSATRWTYRVLSVFSIGALPINSATYLGQPGELLNVALFVQRLPDEPPPVRLVRLDHPVRTGAAAIVALASDDEILETGQEAPDLMWHDAKWMTATVFIRSRRCRCCWSELVLQHGHEHFGQKCRCHGRNTRASDGALLVKRLISDRLLRSAEFMLLERSKLTSAGATTSLQK